MLFHFPIILTSENTAGIVPSIFNKALLNHNIFAIAFPAFIGIMN